LPRFQKNISLLVILLVYLSLACLYSLSTPFFEKADEVYHVAYVKHLADGDGFPSTEPHNPARQEATQSPLYYLLGALLIAGIDTEDMDSLTRLNPHYRPIWDGIAGNNRNRYVHTANEVAPRRGAALAVRLLRCLSIALGSVTVFTTYHIAQATLPDRRWLAAGATAFCAFNPQFLYISGTVNNDVLVAATCALTGLATLRLARAPSPRTQQVATVGLALGASLLSKISALIMIPVVVLALGYAAHRVSRGKRGAWIRLALRWFVVVTLCGGAVCGWWFVRNAMLLDGDLTGAAVHIAKWGRRRRALTLERFLLEVQGLEESYWAVFGLNSIPIERWINLILFAVDRLTLLGGLVLAVKQWTRWRFDRQTRFVLLLVAAWAAGSLASVLYWMYLIKGVNLGRLLYPALSAIAPLMVLGLCQFTPRSWRPIVTLHLGLALCALAIACPLVYILPNYAPPPILTESEVGPLSARLDADLQGQIVLLGYTLPQKETWPGDTLAITLYYQAVVPFGIDYTVFVHFVDAQGNIVVQQDTFPGMGRYPTTLWQPGQIIADTFYLTLPEWTPAPSTGILEAGFYDHETQLRLLVVDENGQAVADSVWFHRMPTIAPPDLD
jgi:hypothetical protein